MKHAREDYNRFQDPLGKIPDDEPVFLLRGQDKLAWHVVKIYAFCAELAGCSPDLVQRCKDHAELMKQWPKKKTPDLPPFKESLNMLEMRYFILKPKGTSEYAKASRVAMRTYAAIISGTDLQMSQELYAWADKEAEEAEKIGFSASNQSKAQGPA